MNSDKNDIQANRMLEIAQQHGLDIHLYCSEPPMCLIGTRASMEAFSKLLERYEELQEEVEELREKLASHDRADSQMSEALNMGDGVYRP